MNDAKDETDDHKSSHAGPIGAGLGLVAAVAAGFFLSEPVDETAETGPQSPDVRPTGLVIAEQIGSLGGGTPPPHRIPPEIVVKFKGELGGLCKDIADQFWADPEGARLRFADLAGQTEALKGLGLKRATYSNELVLELLVVPQGADIRDIKRLYLDAVKRLESSPDVSYAEPNSTAQPGKDD